MAHTVRFVDPLLTIRQKFFKVVNSVNKDGIRGGKSRGRGSVFGDVFRGIGSTQIYQPLHVLKSAGSQSLTCEAVSGEPFHAAAAATAHTPNPLHTHLSYHSYHTPPLCHAGSGEGAHDAGTLPQDEDLVRACVQEKHASDEELVLASPPHTY